MDPLFAWMESSALSEWVRGSECICAFPTIVTLHNVGMAFLAGGGIVIDLRIIGFAPAMPLKPMRRFVPLMWLAFTVNAVTGMLLLIGYPTKALTNPLFYFKLLCVAFGLWLMVRIDRRVILAPQPGGTIVLVNARVLAIASIGVWAAAIGSGRFLAYTCTRLMVDFGKCP